MTPERISELRALCEVPHEHQTSAPLYCLPEALDEIERLLERLEKKGEEAQRNCELCSAAGEANEFASIVEWLRCKALRMDGLTAKLVHDLADAIERGEHQEVKP